MPDFADNTPIFSVPPGHYFVLGDNRHNAADSRFPDRIGGSFIAAEDVRGYAAVIGLSPELARIGVRLDE